MRILFLTLYFDPDMAANSVIMTELAESLVKAGHKVTVVTAFPHYDVNRIWQGFRGRLMRHERRPGLDVFRVYLFVPRRKANILGRLLKYVSFNLLSTLIALWQPRHDVIFAPSPPLTMGLAAAIVGFVRRTPYVYNVQDIYPDVAEKLGLLTRPWLVRAMRWLERFVYRRARAVTVLSDGAWRNLTRKGVPAEKLRLIPNFVNTAFVRPGPKDNAFARAHGLQDRLVVMYAGNIGLSQDLTVMLAAASALRDETAVQFVIVGNGAARDGLIHEARQLGLSNVLFLPFQNRSRLPDVYATADVSVVSLKEGLGEVSVPSKAYTIMASGRPMIAAVGREAETRALLEAAECGLWVPPADASAMVAAIRRLAADSALRRRLGANGRRYVEAHFGPQGVTDQYLRLFALVHEGQERGSL